MAYQENGIYQIVSNRGNGPALSVYGNSQVSNNRNVIVWSRQIISDQKWQVEELSLADDMGKDIRLFIDEIGQYAAITELDEVIVHQLIHKVVVSEKRVINGEKSNE